MTESKRIVLFKIEIDEFYFDDIDNDTLIKEVLANQRRLSNNPNTPLFEDTEFSPKKGDEGYKLLTNIENLMKERGYHIVEWWSQIHQPLESTGLHHHLPQELAFVYYVNAPDGAGDLVFCVEDMEYNIKPRQGKLLFFPAWIKHKVSKNMSDGIRISIAGNAKRVR